MTRAPAQLQENRTFRRETAYGRASRFRRRPRPPTNRMRYAVRGLNGLMIAAGLGAIGLTAMASAEAALALFALLFSVFAYFFPFAAMSVILALTPIQNDLGSGSSPVRFAPAELAMFLAFPAVLMRTNLRPRIGPTFLPTVLYLLVCVVASLNAIRPSMIVSMFQMILYMIIAVLVFSNLEAKPAKLARVFDLYLVSVVGFSIVGLLTNFTFLGTHKNAWGASLSTALVIATDQWLRTDTKGRKRLLTIALIIIGSALIATVSRGGWMASLVGIGIVASVRRQIGGVVRIALLFVPVVIAGWHFLPQELKDYAFGFDTGRENIRLRYESIDYALDHWRKDPLLGVGVGLRKEYDATNIVLLTLAETGWAGLVAFLGVHVSVFWMMRQLIKTVKPTGTMFSFAVLACALVSARLSHGLVDHYWSRGPITCVWAAVGLATLAYQAVQNEQLRQRFLNRSVMITRVALAPSGRRRRAVAEGALR